jgi:long-subunit acyl-CoA synthetase (AMP-forming)
MVTRGLRDAVHGMARDRVALEDATRQVTFGELSALLEEEGAWLAACGERFALLADNGIGWAVTDLALHLRDLVTVPLPGRYNMSSTMLESTAC